MSKGKGDKRVHFHVCYHITGDRTGYFGLPRGGRILCDPIPYTKIRLYPKVKSESGTFLPGKNDRYSAGKDNHYEKITDKEGNFTLNVKESDSLVSFRAEIVSDKFKKYPFPSANKTTISMCFPNPKNIQRYRFEPKELVICRVKAYIGNIELPNEGSAYLSQWRNETFTLERAHQISLQAFLLDIEMDNQQMRERSESVATVTRESANEKKASTEVKKLENEMNKSAKELNAIEEKKKGGWENFREVKDLLSKATSEESQKAALKKNEEAISTIKANAQSYKKIRGEYDKKKLEHDNANEKLNAIKKVKKAAEYYTRGKDRVLFLDDVLARQYEKDVMWAYKLVGETIDTKRGKSATRREAHPDIGAKGSENGYIIINDNEGNPKTGLNIKITLNELFADKPNVLKELEDNESNIVFFAFSKHYEYEGGEEKEETKPIYCSLHRVKNNSNKDEYSDRVKNIASIELKVLKKRYRLEYDGYEFRLLQNENIYRTYPMRSMNSKHLVLEEGEHDVSLQKDGQLGIILKISNFYVMDLSTYTDANSRGKVSLDAYTPAGVITNSIVYNKAQIRVFDGVFDQLIKLVDCLKIYKLTVKNRKDIFIEIIRFRQTLHSTISKYIVYERQSDMTYIPLDAIMNDTEAGKQSVIDRVLGHDETIYEGLDHCGYILECPGPDTIMGRLELRIPEGIYDTWWHMSNAKTKKNVLKLESHLVSKGRAILIHIGNTPFDTEGCLLAGTTQSEDSVGKSSDKIKALRKYFKEYVESMVSPMAHKFPCTVIIRNQFEEQ